MGFLACCKSELVEGDVSSASHSSTTKNKKFKKMLGLCPRRKNLKQIAADGRALVGMVKSLSLKSGKQCKVVEEMQKLSTRKCSVQVFTFRQMAIATNNFNCQCLVGEGGFGRVYKGYIPGIDHVVAVKQLDRNGLQGNREFESEVLTLSLVEHPNLVNLMGYCADGDQRILVYEYMANGSLEDHLLDLEPDKEPLEWHTRMKIAEGAAKGLEYLHEQANPPVIYRDFKASNILLNEDYNPKLSDFGLARIGPTGDKDHVSTRVMGTYGYCAPEYAMTGKLTTKSDVYSFGVVFLELISGRRAIDQNRPVNEQNLVAWAEPLFRDRKLFPLLADPLLKGKYPMKGLYQALAVAAMCLQEEASARPLISDVVTALDILANPSSELGSPRNSYLKEKEEDSDEGDDYELEHSKEHKEEQRPVYVDKLEKTCDFMM